MAQISVPTTAQSYCINIADPGNLSQAATSPSASSIPKMNVKALVIASLVAIAGASCSNSNTTPTVVNPTPAPSPVTSAFTSRLSVQGSTARMFTASKAGPVTVTLVSAGTPVVGLGLGVPYGGIASCSLYTALNASPKPAPQITTQVDPGTYCVVVYDIGTLTDTINFEVTIVYP